MRVKDVGSAESAAEAMPARNDLGPRARALVRRGENLWHPRTENGKGYQSGRSQERDLITQSHAHVNLSRNMRAGR